MFMKINDVRSRYENMFISVFDGDVLQLPDINYELKFQEDILILPHVVMKDGHAAEGYYTDKKLFAIAKQKYIDFDIVCNFSVGFD